MDAGTVVAICATIIAVVSLAVSVYEGRATRRHYRLSVRPLLQLAVSFHTSRTAGLRLVNVGLGPAVITKTVLSVGGELLGEFNESNVNKLRARFPYWPHATTFGGGVSCHRLRPISPEY
jgi:hypothetical protein